MNFEDIVLPTITDEEWETNKEVARVWCRESLGRHSMMPHLMVWSTQDVGSLKWGPIELWMMAFALEWNDENKTKYLNMIAADLAKQRRIPVALIFISEAWMSSGPIDMKNRPMPADDPNSWEVLQAAGFRTHDQQGHILSLDELLENGWAWHLPVRRENDDPKNPMVQDGEAQDMVNFQARILVRFLQRFIVYAAGFEPMPNYPDAKLATIDELKKELGKDEPKDGKE